MEELRPEDLEELVQELAEEYGAPEPPPPEVEELLRELQSGGDGQARREAAEQLGKLDTSSPRIVQALIVARKSDTYTIVRDAAARALRAPVHQDCMQEHPHVMQSAESMAKDMRREERVVRDIQPMEAASLSPSELILLHGDKFAKTSSAAVKFGAWVRLVHIDTDADARELGETMLAAAFLANEQAGAVHLEVRRQQALLGLLNRDKLYVVPGEHSISWPSRSFESQLHQIAVSLQSKSGKGHNHVSEIIYDWWMRREGRKSRFPWSRLGDLVFDGLLYRGLLQKERKSGLKGLLAGASYVLPAETAALAAQQSPKPVVELLATCRRTRPEVWDLLIEGIDKGIGKCEEPPDWD